MGEGSRETCPAGRQCACRLAFGCPAPLKRSRALPLLVVLTVALMGNGLAWLGLALLKARGVAYQPIADTLSTAHRAVLQRVRAYLRYHQEGKRFRPHVVLIGFMSENIRRAVTVYRPFYQPESRAPLAKPRFRTE
jgi:hypothetical protein